ncbi:TerD family protein [Williamsia sterculiae]|uniref:Stress response protein SCP2 n=1 Tax=Williamsia sterculiae TaxID=1344003 RepID=A0A1N7EP01_9NOCA|nr:TerD family protein [Williamsia sterculiae]SIR89800.1 Stress response protein SCP2 [Williamsia sterculiae]
MTMTLAKGQNGPLNTDAVTVSVDLATAGDVSALLVTENGTVRTDADFVFYNQPTGPGVALRGGAGIGTLELTLSAIPADIAQVRAVITLDSGTFGAVAAPVAHVIAGGQELYNYTIDGLSSESIVIALEVYRRGGAWKVRAVGQGYAGGFAALVTDHGVSVDDQPAPTPPAAPTAPAPPPPPATAAPRYERPTAAPQHQRTADLAAGAAGEVSLTKDRPISLTKGQRVSLKKDGGVALTRIMMGLGWDPITKRGGFLSSARSSAIDLDASAILVSGGRVIDIAYYGQLVSKDASIRHRGDNLTGEGEGDDEVIDVDLTRIHPSVDQILFIVTSYQGQTFEQIDNAFCRLVDATTDIELARYTLAGGMPFTGLVMAKVYRAGPDWKLEAIGEGISARHPGEAVKSAGGAPAPVERFITR